MKRRWIPAALAVLLSMVVYLGSLDAEFVYDDLIYIVQNPQLESPGDCLFTPFPAYMGTERGLYRPMTTASLALDRWLFGPDPWGFHLTNLLLHGLGTLACFLLLSLLLEGPWAPFWGALLFGLHPARSEAVAWAVGRSEILGAVGCLLALYFYIRFTRKKGSVAMILLALAAFALAALSKENALALPGILLAYEALVHRDDPWRLRLLRIAPFLVVLLLVLTARFAVLGALSPQGGEQVLPRVLFPERMELALWVLSRYVGLAFFPLHLRPHYRPMAFQEADLVDLLPGILFLVAVAAVLAADRRLAFAAALFLLPLIPVLNLVPIGEAVAERFLYFPLTGLALVFGVALSSTTGKKSALWAGAAAGVLAVGFGATTVRQVEVWTDHFTLWSHGAAMDPRDPQARFGLGSACLERGMLEGELSALSEFKKTRKLNPNYKPDQVFFNLGRTYEKLGNHEEAVVYYMKAIERIPFFVPAIESVLKLDRRQRETSGEGWITDKMREKLMQRLRRFTNTE